MVKKKKIAVFLGDFFWSSIPYDGVPLYNFLSEHFETDLLMFSNDIRLNKVFGQKERFKFNRDVFRSAPNLQLLDSWADLYEISSKYDIIISSAHIAPKTRYPIRHTNPGQIGRTGKITQCPIAIWDIGGCDLITNGTQFADYFFVKGPIWKEWLVMMGFKDESIFVTGTPHYDGYLSEFKSYAIEPILNKEQFDKKYLLNNRQKILLMPTNPASHISQFKHSMDSLEKVIGAPQAQDFELLVKTYPHDYIFYEKGGNYSGVYKRIGETSAPQYEYIKNRYPKVKIIDSQDHFSAIKYVDKIFNMAGSHVAWETYYTDTTSYAFNYESKKYYKKLPYLPDYIEFPDEYVNLHIDNLSDILYKNIKINKTKCDKYFLKELSLGNILQAVKKIINKKA